MPTFSQHIWNITIISRTVLSSNRPLKIKPDYMSNEHTDGGSGISRCSPLQPAQLKEYEHEFTFKLPVYDRLTRLWNFESEQSVFAEAAEFESWLAAKNIKGAFNNIDEYNSYFNNFQNDKTSKQMEQPTKEQVLKAAASCSTAKSVLKILYPAAFDDTERDAEHFCVVGQMLKRKGYDHNYAVIMKHKGYFQLMNLSQHGFWATTGRSAQQLGQMNENGAITRGMFKKFLDQTSFPIDEFTPQ
jgi:hypothetical protein